jgi:hypothetical protein
MIFHEVVPKSVQKKNRWDQTVIWDWPKETHFEDGEITKKYWKWRNAGMNAKYPIRYPVGYSNRSKCRSVIYGEKGDYEELDYVKSRKKVYAPVYISLVKKEKKFKELKKRYEDGEHLMIIDVDGPNEWSLDYYKDEYGVDDDFIKGDSMKASKKNLHIMLNDTKHPFGHGYCLAMALKGYTVKDLKKKKSKKRGKKKKD